MVIAEQNISRRKLKRLHSNAPESAAAMELVYVSDKDAGISREGTDLKSFTYRLNGKAVTDEATLLRIRKLVLPPAWQQVWICAKENGHLQATGLDQRGRKQYKYHHAWTTIRSHTKFTHLHELGKVLPEIRQRLNKDLSVKGLTREKVLAAVVSIMLETGIRIGSAEYEKVYGSFGLTTLKDQHAKINGSKVSFSFKGKKGVYQKISLSSKKLAHIVQQCRDIPGKELFQYYDADGHRCSIDSGSVNSYIKEISAGNFTAKDFRTWTGTITALKAFRELGCSEVQKEVKERLIAALDRVSEILGNTRAVCKKYYVLPRLMELYECRELQKFFDKLETETPGPVDGYSPEERVLMKILEKG